MPFLTPDVLQQVEYAAFLIRLGVTTVEKVRAIFAEDGHDDEALAAILVEVDRRLARRA